VASRPEQGDQAPADVAAGADDEDSHGSSMRRERTQTIRARSSPCSTWLAFEWPETGLDFAPSRGALQSFSLVIAAQAEEG